MNTYIMNFFSIDCSTEIGSLFVKIKSKTFNKILQSEKSNNDLLMKQILDFFKENDLSFDDISNILVNQGPGSFSGLRGSIATAKGISLSKNLELFGYNNFLWPCTKFFNKNDFIYSLIKFRDSYFVQEFNRNLNNKPKIQKVTENELLKKYDKKLTVTKKNEIKYFDKRILKLNNLCIVETDYCDLEFLKMKGLLNKDLIRPFYLS